MDASNYTTYSIPEYKDADMPEWISERTYNTLVSTIEKELSLRGLTKESNANLSIELYAMLNRTIDAQIEMINSLGRDDVYVIWDGVNYAYFENGLLWYLDDSSQSVILLNFIDKQNKKFLYTSTVMADCDLAGNISVDDISINRAATILVKRFPIAKLKQKK